jgi:hypothetical protein
MLWQDRRALRTVARGMLYLGALVVPLPLIQATPPDVLAVAVLSACATILVTYFMLLFAIR